MDPINRVNTSSPINTVQPTTAARTEQPAANEITRGRDTVELSGVQNYLQTLRTNDIRMEKVAEIKAQVDADTYETEEKFDIAAGRLLDDLE